MSIKTDSVSQAHRCPSKSGGVSLTPASTRIVGVSQEHQIRVNKIVGLSLRVLDKMYYEDALRFCYTIRKGINEKDPPSFRYTAITLLGLDQAKQWGLPVGFPLDKICADLTLHAAEEKDLGNKALALWAALTLRCEAADKALDALLAHNGFITNMQEGVVRSCELAWVVYSLAMAWAEMEQPGGSLARASLKDVVWRRLLEGINTLRSQRNGRTGLFQCAAISHENDLLRHRMKTTSGFFDSQVYGAMALARAGQVLGNTEFLQEAYGTVQTILRHQGKYGEWPWHYNVRNGTIIDPYPIFSVHQDGMGPMVLLEVGEALGIAFQEAVERSLTWVFGLNELQIPLIDWEREIIWRAQRRRGTLQRIMQVNRAMHHYRVPFVANLLRAVPGLTIQYECRPYHLGWVLYAFCRRSQLSPEATNRNI